MSGCVSPAPYHLRKDCYAICVRPLIFIKIEIFIDVTDFFILGC